MDNPNQVPKDESNSNPNTPNNDNNDNSKCTFIYSSIKMINQKLFTCKTCHLKESECICEVCARKCHAGHDVHFIGLKDGYCDCGAGYISCRCLFLLLFLDLVH